MVETTQSPQESVEPAHAGSRLLVTKLRAPRAASDGVVRDRLIRIIERGVNSKLTLIVTPAGYGKSTLASQWLFQTERPAAWLSLDDSDNDFLAFFEYLIAALLTIDSTMVSSTDAMIRSPFCPPARDLVSSLVNEIAETIRPFVLVLDDFHVITSQEVQASVQQLVATMPSNMSLIITSRKEPNLPTLRMSARGELIELGPNELGFTAEEAREFLLERQQLDLTRSEVEAIAHWAEGWPVAFRLVATSLYARSPEQVRDLLDSLEESLPALSDYLWDEAIQSQSYELRTFMLRTSFLRQINPEIAAELTGEADAAALLKRLSQDNLFISRLDGPGNWYRYHHLFSAALGERLVQETDPLELKRMHERAALWYEANGHITEAAHHAVQAETWPLASRLLLDICGELYDQERIGALRLWLGDLPDEPLSMEPKLALWLAWACTRLGQERAARRPIAIVEAASSDSSLPEVSNAMLQLRALKLFFAGDHDAGKLALLTLLENLPEGDSSDRARALILLGMLQDLAGSLTTSQRTLETASSLAGRIGVRGLQIAALSATASVQLSMGLLREPADLYRRVRAIGDEWNDLAMMYATHRLGGIHFEWNQLDQAAEHAELANELARRMNSPFQLGHVAALRARIHAANGLWDHAFDEIEHAIASCEAAGFHGIIPTFEEMKCRWWLMSGQPTLAHGWLQYSGIAAIESTRYQDIPAALTAIRVLMHDGRFETAIEHLERLRSWSANQGWNRALLQIHILRAIAEMQTGNLAEARSAAAFPLEVASTEGFLRSFLDEGPQVIPVLRIAADSGASRVYARALLGAAGEPGGEIEISPTNESGILSPREGDVMRLVASGLSNRDVADSLFISEETVKTHLRRIFEKLEVSSRTQAIHRCQQLGLL